MPPRSPDITPMDFFLWGVFKDSVYSRKPHTIDELKDYIHDTFYDLDNDPTLCLRTLHKTGEVFFNNNGKILTGFYVKRARRALRKPGVYQIGYTTKVGKDRVYPMRYT
ncbi:hypothetical protein J6590_082019 [Homalodisca vitripennis]|nr:hypothetical protein J6590_082019 [Homalodisca vitripennis]